MMYVQYDVLTDEQYKQDVWTLLCRYDHSFVPPLSNRESTSQTNLSLNRNDNVKPTSYFDNILNQAIIVSIDKKTNHVVGFMSYKPEFISEDLNDNVDTLYITTIIVDEQYRGRGITSTFYELIEQIGIACNKPIMTRTWSTNDAHIRVLKKVGLEEIKRLTNARGQGIDTVYYRKHLGG